MEEDVGVKATVSRLRRRLSVEQSEDGSVGGSPGPATPTKKRGGRLAAKPQLELIDENTPVSSPRKTRRKSLATDAEEKAITPSRRSVRIKSNTSIVSDTLSVQATASPRAQRAARRYSQTGSDNEGPVTPARQTRRTRKDSASSVENQESGTLNKPLPVAEMVIEEEPENEVQKAVNKSKSSPTAATEELSPNERKSQRLLEKRSRRSGSLKADQDCSSCSIENNSLNISIAKEKVPTETESHSPSSSNKSVKSKESNDDLSESNMSLLNTLETKSKRNKLNHNKSASALDTSGNVKSKRNRTESWPTVTASIANESISFSDNELSKKRKEKSNRSFSATDDSSKKNKSNTSVHETITSQSFLDTSSKRKKRKSETNIENAAFPCEDVQTEMVTPKANTISVKKTPSDKSGSTDVTSDMVMLFENRPDNVQISVYYEDSDSNSVVTETVNQNEKIDSEDQCVPVVDVIPNAEKNIISNQVSDNNEKVSSTDVSISQLVSSDFNDSCEPMDIDETIHEDILQKSLEQTHRQSLSSSRHSIIEETENSKRKTSISGSAAVTPDQFKSDKRKSSISNSAVDTPDQSKSDNKKSSISSSAVDTPDQSKSDKRKSSISNSAVDTPDQSKSDKRKLSISNSAVDTPNQSKSDKRKSSISNSAVDTPDQSKSDKRKSSISNSAVDTPNQSKSDRRKSSISNSAVDTPDQSKSDKRKSSISNSAVDTPNQSKSDKRKSSISNSAVDTPDQSKNDKRKSSISNSAVDTPDQSKNDKRTSSISNSTADTPDLSKNDNNKSTLILSQLKDVSNTSENLKSPKSALINEVLSKSDMNERGSKKIFKGNLSANDLKGTPKQNSVQKLTMQTSTPIASQQMGIKTKVEEQKPESASKKNSNFSKSINDTDSSDEDSDDDLSVEKNEHLDDEAEEASDDYESGDSQDEEEIKYVAENEIVERGETLTSNDDASNDTDYEKDSFVVSSDAEDNDLLSGSEDDLSMSDNELSMSKKSKKKFNDRKLKEQKNASREMFESRHKLNTSGKNSPTPKTKKNRMRIDSSLLASDEEVVVKPKKPNRMRLDSTLDTSVTVEETNVLNKSNKNKSTLGTSVTQDDTNTSLKKKKNKSMQDSICNKSAVDEIEITVCNESAIENADPLQMQMKQEPKTPQKDLNMSVVQVQQDIESVQVNESNYILDQTGTDPLQATACEYTSDSSESEEILQNYDSVLNELNKDRKTKLNNKNASLNMGKKSKKEPIIDQLNLTQAKKSKKNKDQAKDDSGSKTVKLFEKKQDSDNDSSSSIDLQLLFSEDNCGSDDEQMSQNKADDDNTFIPLKKSPGKTNLRDSIGMNTLQTDTNLNESSKKNKKRNSLIGAESVDEQDVVNESILNKSNSKKKKQKVSLTAAESQELDGTPNAVELELNESTKKKKKRQSSLSAQTEGDLFFIDTTGSLQDNKDECGEFAEPSLDNVYERKKKKKTKLDDVRTKTEQNENTAEESNAASEKKKKKKKHSISEPSFVESRENTIGNAAITPKSEKKKKKHSISEPSAEETTENTAMTPKSEKKKKKHSISERSAEETPGNLFFIDTAGTLQDVKENAVEDSNAVKTPKGEKKKKQKLESVVHDEDSDGAPDEAPYQSEKASEVDLQNIENVGGSAETGSAKKKHKNKKKKSSVSNQSGESIDTENVTSNSKKRKRKSSNAESSQEDTQGVVESGEVNEFVASNKKLKISYNEDNTSGSNESKEPKKNKKKNRHVNFEDIAASTIETTGTQTKKNKKRKHRDEEDDSKQSKVSKDSSFQEVHVPRLPDSILRQLDDKPRKIEPAKVVSTSNFVVEHARQKRAKPSNYLEESIYLDAKSPIAKKDKSRIRKPKVLPFIPTASTSDSGFTTNFRINKLSPITTFEAEPVAFSKEKYLQKKKIKRLGTYDRYKTQMHHKMAKF